MYSLAGAAVIAAGGGEQEPPDARRFGGCGETHAGAMVDGVGEVGIEIAERVVGERRQMDHRVEAFEIGGQRIAGILRDRREGDQLASRVIGAAAVEIAVIARDLMAGGAQKRRHDGADISEMACQKHFHASPQMLVAARRGGLNHRGRRETIAKSGRQRTLRPRVTPRHVRFWET